jgi:hypothetical protein
MMLLAAERISPILRAISENKNMQLVEFICDQPGFLDLPFTDCQTFACLRRIEHLTITLDDYGGGEGTAGLMNVFRNTLSSLRLVGESEDTECERAVDALVGTRLPQLKCLTLDSLTIYTCDLNHILLAYHDQLEAVQLEGVRIEHDQTVWISLGDDAKRVTQHGYIREMKLSAEVIAELAKNKEIANSMGTGA